MTEDYQAMRRLGVTWRVLHEPHDAKGPSRFALSADGDLLCRDDSVRPTKQGACYVVLRSAGNTTDGQMDHYKPGQITRYPIGTIFEFTVTDDPRDAGHAGVYSRSYVWAFYCPMGDTYHLNGPSSPGSWGSIENYTPVPKGTVFVINAT